MKSEEFITTLYESAKEYEAFDKLRKNIPMGIDAAENIVCARRERPLFFSRHTCVTGGGRSEFIRRLLLTLSCLYDKQDICFLVLSVRADYSELLKLNNMDLTLPYVRTKEDVEQAIDTLKELLRARAYGKGYPRLVVVADGLEELEGCNRNSDLEEYREIIELLSRRDDVDVITGVDLTKSIFSGYPGAYVGIGNCLVATREVGKADVTYVQDDTSLTLPCPFLYPAERSTTETVLAINSLTKTER